MWDLQSLQASPMWPLQPPVPLKTLVRLWLKESLMLVPQQRARFRTLPVLPAERHRTWRMPPVTPGTICGVNMANVEHLTLGESIPAQTLKKDFVKVEDKPFGQAGLAYTMVVSN